MRIVLAVATGIAVALLVMGPVTHIRAQQSRPVPTANTTPASASPEPTPRVDIDSTSDETADRDPSVRTTDELVRARIVHSPATPLKQVKPKPAPPKRSLLARLFLGAGGHRPQPFPRPGS